MLRNEHAYYILCFYYFYIIFDTVSIFTMLLCMQQTKCDIILVLVNICKVSLLCEWAVLHHDMFHKKHWCFNIFDRGFVPCLLNIVPLHISYVYDLLACVCVCVCACVCFFFFLVIICVWSYTPLSPLHIFFFFKLFAMYISFVCSMCTLMV